MHTRFTAENGEMEWTIQKDMEDIKVCVFTSNYIS